MKKQHKSKLSVPKSHKSRRFVMPKVRKKHASSINEDKLPRITNDTVSKHREEVISGAKKYIYPLKHSHHKIVIITVSILVALFIGASTLVLLNLYAFQNTSKFMYQITKVLPLPVGKIGGTFIPYEQYLFELRHYIYYFENQIEVDFDSEQGMQQLEQQKKQTLDEVVDNAYALKIARENNITVSSEEVNDQIELLRSQNLIGNDQQVFEDVLKSFYDWDINDMKRIVKQQLLNAKVAKFLDPGIEQQATKALAEIKAGKDFAAAAKQYSYDESTKNTGGEVGVIDDTKAYMRQELAALRTMKKGDVSDVITTDNGLVIVKHMGLEGGKIKAAHIVFSYKPLTEYLNDIKEKQPATLYIKIEQES